MPKLILVAGPGTDNDNSDICSLSSGDSLIETGLVARPALTTLCEGNSCDVLVKFVFEN